MNDRELERLLIDLESDRVERKSSLSDPEKVREAICAFANDLPGHNDPGVLFVGAKEDGDSSGLRITDELLRKLSDMRSDGNITPFPSLTVQKRRLRGQEFAVVLVQPSPAPPVRCRGRTWIRVGPRRAIATAEEERRLTERRRSRDLPYDLQSIPSSSVDDLDVDLFRRVYLPAAYPPDVLEQNTRTLESQLASLRMVGLEGKPTVLGVLVLGNDPRRFIPGAYVQFLRIEGAELTDPIKDQREIDGPLPDLLRALDDALQAHISLAADLRSGSVEARRPDFPLVALQQFARNAVMHRVYEGTNAPVRIQWFEDRVEIQSPGGPFGQVNRSNFGTPGTTDYRNPHLAEAMKVLGYVQRFGLGIPLAKKELEKNGNPPPAFEVGDTHLLVTVRRPI